MDEKTRDTAALLLRQAGEGDAGAADQLFELIHAALHGAAEGAGAEGAGVEPVHALYARLFAGETGRWEDRRRFLTAAAGALRSILVEHAGAGRDAGSGLDALAGRFERRIGPIGAFDGALRGLQRDDPRAARVAELRVFACLSPGEVAGVLQLPKRTVERDWTYARIRLMRLLAEQCRD